MPDFTELLKQCANLPVGRQGAGLTDKSFLDFIVRKIISVLLQCASV